MRNILRQDSLTQHKPLKSILKDVRTSNADMDKTKQMRVAKTIKQLNEDPTKVLSKFARKEALGALRDAGDLRNRYNKNFGAAMKSLQSLQAKSASSVKEKTFSELKDMSPSQLTKEERRRLEVHKNKMRARAVEERENVEGAYHAGNHKTTRFGLEAWQNSKVSANSSQRRQSTYAVQSDDAKNSKPAASRPPMIDMMID